MDARLIIESDDACDLASRLASLTGDSVTDAVTNALRAELERQQRERDVEAKVARVLSIAKDIHAHIEGPASSDLQDLYDEDGLPL